MQDPSWLDIATVAERQWGLVRRGDLVELSLHGRRAGRWVLDGHLHEFHPGVYALVCVLRLGDRGP